MKPTSKFIFVSALALASAPAAFSASVILNVDSSYEGLATAAHTPLGSGIYEVGWLNAGVGQAQIVSFFNAGNLAAIDTAFNTVSIFNFTPTSPETAEPNVSLGLVFSSITLVADGNAAGLAAYKDPGTGAAGKAAYIWIRNPGSTQMAFVDAGQLFGLANDTIGGTDFNTDVATASDVINAANVWVGSIADVVAGGAIDLNGNGTNNNQGYYGGANVLQLSPVVPEPSTALAIIGGLGLLGLRRRRA